MKTKRILKPWKRLERNRFRPTRPPGRSGPMDRTAGGIGAQPPLHLIHMVKVGLNFCEQREARFPEYGCITKAEEMTFLFELDDAIADEL
jgi:hypothetical protein